MPKAWSDTKTNKRNNKPLRAEGPRACSPGFSAVEVLLAATVFGILVTALIGALVYGRQSTALSGERQRATMLAEEGIEAARNLRDAAYTNLADGTYGLVQAGSTWTLSGSSDTSGIFTRSLTIASVDTQRKNVTATVTWPHAGGASQTSTTSRLTNWMTAFAKTWPNATLAGAYNASSTNNAFKVVTAGNFAYVVRSGGTPSFMIVNVSTPASPTLTGSLALAANPTNIFISGNYAYVTTSSDSAELQIVNISNPAAPVLTGTYNASGNGNGKAVFVSGSYAYLVRAANGGAAEFVIINISNPASPVLTGAYGNNIDMNDIAVSGNYAFVGTNSTTQAILAINISLPLLPTLGSSFSLTTSGTVNAVDLIGTTLLVGQATTFSILDASNPLAITRTGTLTTTGSAAVNDIDTDSSNTYAFLATSNTTAEFQIANISNQASPSIVRTVDVPGTASTLSGVAYNSSLDIVVGASASDTQEVPVFIKN